MKGSTPQTGRKKQKNEGSHFERCQKLAVDRHRISEKVQNRTMSVDSFSEFSVPDCLLWPAQSYAQTRCGKTRPKAIINSEKATNVEVTLDVDFDLVELNAEVSRPELIMMA